MKRLSYNGHWSTNSAPIPLKIEMSHILNSNNNIRVTDIVYQCILYSFYYSLICTVTYTKQVSSLEVGKWEPNLWPLSPTNPNNNPAYSRIKNISMKKTLHACCLRGLMWQQQLCLGCLVYLVKPNAQNTFEWSKCKWRTHKFKSL